MPHQLLTGHATVCTTDPWTLLHAVPPLHYGCMHGWSLVPFEDHISSLPFFRWTEYKVPFILGWYTVSKCGIYHHDITYSLSFNEESGVLQVLVAAPQLKPSEHTLEDDIGQDVNAHRLFSPVQCNSASSISWTPLLPPQVQYLCVQSTPIDPETESGGSSANPIPSPDCPSYCLNGKSNIHGSHIPVL